MEKYILSYNEALELKNLGFNEACFGYFYNSKELIHIPRLQVFWNKNSEIHYMRTLFTPKTKAIKTMCTAPLFSQAFEFFRTKYGLYVSRQPEFYTTGINFNWQILWY